MKYISHLSKDKKLAAVLKQHGAIKLVKRKPVHLLLVYSIMSQQLSTKVADTLRKRFLNLFHSKTPTADEIVALPFDTLRGIGLSNSKTQYILNVAQFFVEEKNAVRKLAKLNNEEAIEYLTQIKGVGRWTAEMLLMFTLGREDVFPADDYGIQVAMKKLYKLNDTNKKAFREKMQKIASAWHPYQTYACMHLWQWKDTK